MNKLKVKHRQYVHGDGNIKQNPKSTGEEMNAKISS